MVYRVFVEKKCGLAHEADSLLNELVSLVGIKGLKTLRILNRYDVENISEELFETSKNSVFSEPQLDNVSEELALNDNEFVFAVEYLPGQFDQRADSAAQCIQLISQQDKPLVRTAKVYVLTGEIGEAEVNAVKKYVINAVESREASMEKPETLNIAYEIPESVAVLEGFTELD